MKIFAVLSAIMVFFLLIGCGEDTEKAEDEEVSQTGQYQGFPEMKGGEWAEHTTDEGDKTRYEYFGTDTIDDYQCYVIEFEVEVEGEVVKTISQVWIDQETQKPVLYIIKQVNIVIKIDVSKLPELPTAVAEGVSGATPSEYIPGGETSFEDYETPTGKKVWAAIFKKNSDEVWVSESVPFGLVKTIDDGKTLLQLYDFDLSGAKRDISKEDIETAQEIGIVPDIPNLP